MKFDGKKPVNPHYSRNLNGLPLNYGGLMTTPTGTRQKKSGASKISQIHTIIFVRFSQCLTISIKQKYTNKPVLGFAIRFVVVLAI